VRLFVLGTYRPIDAIVSPDPVAKKHGLAQRLA
jgi:hypothetical protein